MKEDSNDLLLIRLRVMLQNDATQMTKQRLSIHGSEGSTVAK